MIAPKGLLRQALSVPPLRYVGRISYGLYLWHWPIIVFVTADRTGLAGNRLNALRIVIIFGITIVSYHLIEQPILRRRPRMARTRALLPIGLSVVLVSVLAGTAGASSPTQELGRITGTVGRCGPAPDFETARATTQLRELGGVPIPRSPTPLRIAVFGDSRACSIMTGMEVVGKQINAKVANGAMLGCGIVAGAISKRYPMMPRAWADSCQRRVDHIVTQELARSDPQVVVWLSGWELNDLDLGDHDAIEGTPEHDRVLLDRMERMYQRTRAPGASSPS